MAEIFGYPIMGGGGSSGGTLTVTGVAGSTVTVSNADESYTRTLDSAGEAIFKGLDSGTWTVTMTNGSQTATRSVEITADYSVSIAYFAATINVTYPAGSICTATDGTTILTAPDTTGTWACIVGNTGTWTISCTKDSQTATNTVTISTDGESKSLTLSYRLYLFSETDGNVGGFVVRNNFTIDSNFMKLLDGDSSNASLNTWVDLSNYNTLYIDSIRTYAGTLTRGYISPSKSTTIAETGLNFGTSLTRKVESLDISAYSGSYNICIHGSWTVATIYNIWLE